MCHIDFNFVYHMTVGTITPSTLGSHFHCHRGIKVQQTGNENSVLLDILQQPLQLCA